MTSPQRQLSLLRVRLHKRSAGDSTLWPGNRPEAEAVMESPDDRLSDHAIILRSILLDVEKQAPTADAHYLSKPTCSKSRTDIKSAAAGRKSAESIELQRRQGLRDFLAKCSQSRSPIDIVRMSDIDDDSKVCSTTSTSDDMEILLTPLEFKQRYIYRNVPAIVRGLDDKNGSFHNLVKSWRRQNPDDGETSIQYAWFSHEVGVETKVPVREPLGCSQSASALDEEGRARECHTVEMPIDKWIQYCRDNSAKAISTSTEENKEKGDGKLYLKDWHLVNFLENQTEKKDSGLLYQVPSIFEKDLLNLFLQRYFQGDFRFAYWGPAGSSTAIHSDVLNSFSWSFNVVGEKEWTFYCPPSSEGLERDTMKGSEEESSFVLRCTQHEGEAIFVPSGWRHEVTNKKETLSVNHNWFTAASVDRIWECILIETKAVEDECTQWDVPSDDWDAREQMLRGCIGLNVSMFFFVLLLSLLEEMSLLESTPALSEQNAFECHFNIHRISNQLRIIMLRESSRSSFGADEEERSAKDICNVQLAQRLGATLMSQALAHRTLDLANKVVDVVDEWRSNAWSEEEEDS